MRWSLCVPQFQRIAGPSLRAPTATVFCCATISTEAASKFQTAELISYRRGRISVLDAQGLGKKACECYRFIGQQYRRLQGKLSELLWLK
jgi:hypothetical protein